RLPRLPMGYVYTPAAGNDFQKCDIEKIVLTAPVSAAASKYYNTPPRSRWDQTVSLRLVSTRSLRLAIANRSLNRSDRYDSGQRVQNRNSSSVPPRLASTPFAAGFELSAVGANRLCRLELFCELVADGAVPGRLRRTPPEPGDGIARIGLLEQLPGARPKVVDALRGSDFIVHAG